MTFESKALEVHQSAPRVEQLWSSAVRSPAQPTAGRQRRDRRKETESYCAWASAAHLADARGAKPQSSSTQSSRPTRQLGSGTRNRAPGGRPPTGVVRSSRLLGG